MGLGLVSGLNRHILKVIPLCLLLVACAEPKTIVSPVNNGVSPDFAGPPEISYCTLASAQTYSPASTITGTATYQARQIFYISGSNNGLGAAGAAQPIRYAEVRVTDAAGNVVQCAETDASGNFSFTLPQNSSTYTISVNARADNNRVKISVLDAPQNNTVYALTTTVVPNTSKSVGTINASVTGDILGGAFNIYDQILNSNEFLRTQVGGCSGSITGCTDFVVAPKVSAYWIKGFNPFSYYGGTSGLSFYLPGLSRLFILGGLNGDTDFSDTDHFDNSIVIHEYGHFLEDVLSVSNSFGGSHSGTTPVDPRLAWSEGFANFLQAAVTGIEYYQDSSGNTDGSTGLFIRSNLEYYGAAGCTVSTGGGSCCSNSTTAGCDITTITGEGNYREFAISRFLWDAHDTNNDTYDAITDTISGGFPEIWAAMTMSTGFKKSTFAYRSVGLLNHIQDQVIAATNWSTLRNMHKMDNTTAASYRAEFAYLIDEVGGCAAVTTTTGYSIDPVLDAGTGPHYQTDLVRNNEFFHYKHTGGTITFTLNYITPAGTEADLDLYIYDDADKFFLAANGTGTTDDYLARSIASPSTGSAGNTESESFTVNLSAGDYLINVSVGNDHVNSSNTFYELRAGGTLLCPASQP